MLTADVHEAVDRLLALPPEVQAAIREFRVDPATQNWNTTEDIGACWTSSRHFARLLARRCIDYTFRRYNALPGWRTQVHHVIEVDGVVVDWTARQYRAGADWPHLLPLEEFEAEFGEPLWHECCDTCGSCGDLRLIGKKVKRRPLREHVCQGPEPDPLEAVTALLVKMERRFTPTEFEAAAAALVERAAY